MVYSLVLFYHRVLFRFCIIFPISNMVIILKRKPILRRFTILRGSCAILIQRNRHFRSKNEYKFLDKYNKNCRIWPVPIAYYALFVNKNQKNYIDYGDFRWLLYSRKLNFSRFSGRSPFDTATIIFFNKFVLYDYIGLYFFPMRSIINRHLENQHMIIATILSIPIYIRVNHILQLIICLFSYTFYRSCSTPFLMDRISIMS